MSLSDLCALGNTCKTMQQVVGQYFQRNYASAEIYCYDDHIHISRYRNINSLNIFGEFITKIKFFQSDAGLYSARIEDDFKLYQRLNLSCGKCLRHIQLIESKLTVAKIECLRKFAGNIENIHLDQCSMDDEFNENFLKIFPNLNRICIEWGSSETIIGSGSEWLTRKYPKLEQFMLIPNYSNLFEQGIMSPRRWLQSCTEPITDFLELNPNIRHFTTTFACLWINTGRFISSDVKLHNLVIDMSRPIYRAPRFYFDYDFHENFLIDFADALLPNEEFDLRLICDTFKELYKREFYRQLHLCIIDSHHDSIRRIATIPALHRVLFLDDIKVEQLSPLMNVKQLDLKSIEGRDFEIYFPKLERISFAFASYDNICWILRCAPKLKQIKVFTFKGKSHSGGPLDLIALNNERKQVNGACKVSIFVDEKVFVATRWTFENINLSYMEMKRLHSTEWNEDFDYSTMLLHFK